MQSVDSDSIDLMYSKGQRRKKILIAPWISSTYVHKLLVLMVVLLAEVCGLWEQPSTWNCCCYYFPALILLFSIFHQFFYFVALQLSMKEAHLAWPLQYHRTAWVQQVRNPTVQLLVEAWQVTWNSIDLVHLFSVDLLHFGLHEFLTNIHL